MGRTGAKKRQREVSVVAATEQSREVIFSPAELEPEHMIVAFLVHRMRSMPKEALADLIEAGHELLSCSSREDAREIVQTMREILFPETIGAIRAPEELDRPDSLRSRAIYIGCKIKEEREKAGITQEDLAKATGMTQSHVSRLETGQHSPAWRTIEKIAEALKIEARQLDPTAE